MPEPVRVFVSYASSDRAFAEKLVTDLQAAGAEVWWDVSGIDEGDFLGKINQALRQCQWLVLVLTPNAVASKWVNLEVNAAINRREKGLMRGVLPVLASPMAHDAIPPVWDNLHRYDGLTNYQGEIARLIRTLGLSSAPAEPPRAQPVIPAPPPRPSPTPSQSVSSPQPVSSPTPRQPTIASRPSRGPIAVFSALTVLVIAGLLTGLASGLIKLPGGNSPNSGGSGGTTIKICTELPVSGADISAGQPAENGAILAIEQANANKTIQGYTFVHARFDDVGAGGTHDPNIGANNIRSAANDAVVAGCVGPFNSNVALAEMPIANNAPLALISPSNVNPMLTKPEYGQLGALRPTGKVTYFRVTATDDFQGTAGADYFFKQAGVRRVYIIDDTETYGKGIADGFTKEFAKLGGTVVGRKGLNSKTTDFKPTIAQAVTLGAGGIFYGGTDGNGGTLCRVQMVTVPGADKILYAGGDGLLTDSFKTSTLQVNAAGSVVSVASVNADNLTSAAQFKTDFARRFSDPNAYGAFSASAYDATNIEIQAIKKALAGGAIAPKNSGDQERAKAFRQAVIDQIAKIDYNGVIGHTTFDSNGDTTNRIMSIYKVGASDWDFVTQFTVS